MKNENELIAALATIEKLRSERDQLAAENVALKAASDDRRMFIMNGVQLGYIKVPTVETDPALETIRIAVSPQEPTPATDRIVAGIKADGAKFIFHSILDNPAVTDLGSLVDWLEQHANDSDAVVQAVREGVDK